jgi:hypothetical protein
LLDICQFLSVKELINIGQVSPELTANIHS